MSVTLDFALYNGAIPAVAMPELYAPQHNKGVV